MENLKRILANEGIGLGQLFRVARELRNEGANLYLALSDARVMWDCGYNVGHIIDDLRLMQNNLRQAADYQEPEYHKVSRLWNMASCSLSPNAQAVTGNLFFWKGIFDIHWQVMELSETGRAALDNGGTFTESLSRADNNGRIYGHVNYNMDGLVIETQVEAQTRIVSRAIRTRVMLTAEAADSDERWLRI